METSEVIAQIKKANLYITKKRFVEAENILDKLLKSIDPIEIDKHGKVLDFNSHLEFILYCCMDRHTKISWNRNFLSEIYLLKGLIEFENIKYKEAIEFFEKALRWNPVSMSVYNEILESYIALKDFEKFDSCFEKAIKIAARPIDLAVLYKKLAFVYEEKGKDEIAYNLFLYSKLFFPRKEADAEIAYLEKKFGTKLKYFPDLGTIQYLKKLNLEYNRPDYIVPTYINIIKMMLDIMKREVNQTRENYLVTIDYYHGLYFHCPTADIHSAMLSMQREYELKYVVTGKDEG